MTDREERLVAARAAKRYGDLIMNAPLWLRRIYYAIFGRFCERHGHGYRSDFCGLCVREWDTTLRRIDRSPSWTKADGVWPLRKEA